MTCRVNVSVEPKRESKTVISTILNAKLSNADDTTSEEKQDGKPVSDQTIEERHLEDYNMDLLTTTGPLCGYLMVRLRSTSTFRPEHVFSPTNLNSTATNPKQYIGHYYTKEQKNKEQKLLATLNGLRAIPTNVLQLHHISLVSPKR